MKFRIPKDKQIKSVSANGKATVLSRLHNDTVIIIPGHERVYEVVGETN